MRIQPTQTPRRRLVGLVAPATHKPAIVDRQRAVPLFLALALAFSCCLSAQEIKKADDAPEATSSSAEETEKEDGVRHLQGEAFITADGVQMSMNYYPGKRGKETIPVVLLHDLYGSKEQLDDMARNLNAKGMAVLVPDLRGHGKSTKQWIRQRRGGPRGTLKQIDLDAENFEADDFADMARYDVRLMKKFLLYENNSERLNIKKLTLIGAGMGASVAAIWGKTDWTQRGKAARNVQVVVMISPHYSQIANTITANPFEEDIDTMILVGKLDPESYKSAMKIRSEMLDSQSDSNRGFDSPVPLGAYNTERQGIALLGVTELEIPEVILKFVVSRLAEKSERDTRWREI